MSNWLRPLVLISFLGVTSVPVAATAADGVIEINQVRAQAGGVTPGDTTGFPVLITQRGSYRLTSDLTVPGLTTTAIRITAPFVSLDLGGFSIIGPRECFGSPAFCEAPQSGIGIDASDIGRIDVRNGTVQGMGGAGLIVGEGSRVEDVRVIWSGATGISVGNHSRVSGASAEQNGSAGIGGTAEQVIAESCTSFGNVGSGFALGRASTVRGSTSFANGLWGIEFANPSAGTELGLFEGNSLRSNLSGSARGGRATGGNYCDDDLCSIRGTRRFYRTAQSFPGAGALGACTAGFHMASFWELNDLSALEYATALGGLSSGDAGRGAPNDPGWVRTGSPTGSGNNHCDLWTSSTGTGKIATLVEHSSASQATAVTPWGLSTTPCSSSLRVWCVED